MTISHNAPPATRSQYTFDPTYGWFDRSHIGDWGWLLNDVRSAIGVKGGVYISPPTDRCPSGFCGLMSYDVTYWVSGMVTDKDVVGVALGIFKHYETSWEIWQGDVLFGNSSFAIEDLSSDYIGFYASAVGRNAYEVLENDLGVDWQPSGSPPPGGHIDALSVKIPSIEQDGRGMLYLDTSWGCCFQESTHTQFLPAGGTVSHWPKHMQLKEIPMSSGLWRPVNNVSGGVWASLWADDRIYPNGGQIGNMCK